MSSKIKNPDGSKAGYKVSKLKVRTAADVAKEEMIKKAAKTPTKKKAGKK